MKPQVTPTLHKSSSVESSIPMLSLELDTQMHDGEDSAPREHSLDLYNPHNDTDCSMNLYLHRYSRLPLEYGWNGWDKIYTTKNPFCGTDTICTTSDFFEVTRVLLNQDAMEVDSEDDLQHVSLSESADSHTSISPVESPTLVVEEVGMSKTNVTQMLNIDEGSQSSAPRLTQVTCKLPPRPVPQSILLNIR